ncbi:MAG TPA: translation initiation factor IF-6 [Methanoregulaceae archaeon]|nr:translation initiation factor IF-6 [Methanoregulaceae archaeon]
MNRTTAFGGDPHIGIFCRVLEEIAVVPPQAPDEFCEALRAALDVELVRTTVQGSSIVGSLLAGNSRAVVVSGLATPEEIRVLEDYREVYRLEGSMNAAGNVVLANDHFAAVHPEMEPGVIEAIGEHLGVEVIRLTLGGVKTVGMAGYAMNRGVLLNPRATAKEIGRLEAVTDLPIGTGTVNMGSGLVGTGLLANSSGYIAGNETSGFELGRVADVFGFIEGV